MRPYKLKQGVIDFWLPIFLFVRQQEFALYNGETFVLNINKELFELLQKRLNDFTIKAFDVNGIKLELFNKYREFLNKERGETITSNSLMDTIRPFFNFYNGLNKYAKTTRKFDYDVTAKFRDVLATAKTHAKHFLKIYQQLWATMIFIMKNLLLSICSLSKPLFTNWLSVMICL